jgi:molecular chaperone HscB
MAMESNTSSSLIMPGEATATCWSCGTMRAVHFCSACGKVQPPVPVDYFTFFALPRKLNLDIALLEREFYELSRKLHPDLCARADKREQEWSLEQSSLLNDAYRTLKDPIKRTEYLLRLEGVELEEQSKTATEKARTTGEIKKQVVPPDLLEEVFELNMQLERALKVMEVEKALDGDSAKKLSECDPDLASELEALRVSFEYKHKAILDELKICWNDWDKAVGEDSAVGRVEVRDRMVDVLNRRNYIRNLVRDVNEVLQN